MKSALEGINSRLNDTEEQSVSWKKVVKITDIEQKKK